jgi:hypothetical protein
MNNALWSPRGARAGERNRAAGATVLTLQVSTAKPMIADLAK